MNETLTWSSSWGQHLLTWHILTETLFRQVTPMWALCAIQYVLNNIYIYPIKYCYILTIYLWIKSRITLLWSNTYTVVTPDVSLTPQRSVLGLSPGLISFYVTRRQMPARRPRMTKTRWGSRKGEIDGHIEVKNERFFVGVASLLQGRLNCVATG